MLSVEDKTDSNSVKGEDFNNPPQATETPRGAKEESGVASYIPSTPPELPFYCDLFALARLLKDFSQHLPGVDSSRLQWGNHWLTTATMAHEFQELDARLFGETYIGGLCDFGPVGFAQNFAGHTLDGGMFRDIPGDITPPALQGTMNSILNNSLGRPKNLNELKIKNKEHAWKLLETQTQDKETKEYPAIPMAQFFSNIYSILHAIFIMYPEKYNTDDSKRRFAYYIGAQVWEHMDAIIATVRQAYYAEALDALRQLPAGPTVLWHVGLGPKPAKLDYSGTRFGFLAVESMTVIHRSEGKAGAIRRREAVSARCDCGKVVKVAVNDLTKGRAISCGGCGRPRTLTPATVNRWAAATLDNAKRNAEARNQRHGNRFASPEEVLYFAGLRCPDYDYTTEDGSEKKIKTKMHDLSRIDDHRQEVPYAPGQVFWEDAATNRAVETKKLLSSGQLNQWLILKELPDYDAVPEADPDFVAALATEEDSQFDDLL